MGAPIDKYDPAETEERQKSGLVGKRDLKIFLIISVFLALILYPVYMRLLDERNRTICKGNMALINRALLLYAEDNTMRFPPTHVTSENFAPRIFQYKDTKRINTWLSIISGSLKRPLEETKCPGATDQENVPTEGFDGKTLHTSYGLYGALSAVAVERVDNTAGTVLFAETSNQGSRNTYDPLPLKDTNGNPVPNGFMIGLDSTNFDPDDQMNKKEQAKFATRLAFPETAKGKFVEEGPCRHPAGIHFIFVDGHADTMKPIEAFVRHGSANNHWPIR